MEMTVRNAFDRTVCHCEQCRKPCMHMPGMLAPGDLQRIARWLETDEEGLTRNCFRASPGAKVGSINDAGQLETHRIPTIVPASDDTGQCVFLEENGLCGIHAVAPYGCAYFDSHMDGREGDIRSLAVLREIANDKDYTETWMSLAASGIVTEGPEKKRKRMEAAI